MPSPEMRVGYVVKRYPRYSETFIVNEILAHEAAGLQVEVFALLSGTDTHFQDAISRVRAPVTYLQAESLKALDFWKTMSEVCPLLPDSWPALEAARPEEARHVYQAILLARHVRERGITHLHAHFATSATNVARVASRLARVPFTFTAHAKDVFHESVDPIDLRRKLDEAAAVVTVSDYNVEFLRHSFGDSARRVRRIYNGMDLAQLEFTPPTNRPPLILAAGRLVEKKGFHILLNSCQILMRQGMRFKCGIVGTGDQEQALRAQIQRLGLIGHVELLGPQPQREVFRRLREAAVMAVPCVVGSDGNRDGLPTVLLEAMALGTPCVSTDVTGIPEAVRDGKTGLIVPQNDAASLASACKRVIDDAELAARLAAGARRLIEAEFDVRINAAALRELFASVGTPAIPATPPAAASPVSAAEAEAEAAA
jgi:glycosyltransferase involved in cell wall biosynthesis